jgi:hypothetical protein
MADEAKVSIREIGYQDAFVVAIYNGKRINIAKAREMLVQLPLNTESLAINTPSENNSLDNNTSDNNTSENNTLDNNTSENNTLENNTSENNTSENNTLDNETSIQLKPVNENLAVEKTFINEVKDGVSTDVRNINGAFYTIQVGVYSKEVTAGELNNVTPINSERTASGLIRYTSGVYRTSGDANAAKKRIRDLGIVDAFVVAYLDGKKVAVSAVSSQLEVSLTPSENTTTNESVEENTSVTDVAKKLNILFKVKLGEYIEDVPVKEAGLFLQLSSRGIENYEDGEKTSYSIGSFLDYKSALDLQVEMKETGVNKPEIIVFQNGNEIEIEEALELIKKNK